MKKHLYAMTAREHDTVLAALRLYQRAIDYGNVPIEIAEIASNGTSRKPFGSCALDNLCERLNHTGLEFADITPMFGKDDSDPYVAAAREHRLLEEGTLEVDVPAVVSNGGDGGAYVQAWLWIDDEELA